MLCMDRSKPILIQSLNNHINKFFGGGLQYGMITQLYGESGSGKTQTAMLFGLGVLLVFM
jgi:RecA/RadA recombinase